jgi:hypothetical protein
MNIDFRATYPGGSTLETNSLDLLGRDIADRLREHLPMIRATEADSPWPVAGVVVEIEVTCRLGDLPAPRKLVFTENETGLKFVL